MFRDSLTLRAALAWALACAFVCASAPALGQGLLGLGGESEGVALAISETPIERLQRELLEREESLSQRLDRFNTEAAWARERLNARREGLREQMDEYAALRSELNPIRDAELRHLLGQLGREAQIVVGLTQQVEDARDAHLSAFLQATSTARHSRVSLDSEVRLMAEATAADAEAHLAALAGNIESMQARRDELIQARADTEALLATVRDRLETERQDLRRLEGELASDLLLEEQSREDAGLQAAHVREAATSVATEVRRVENEALADKLTSLSFLVARRLLHLRSWSFGAAAEGLARESNQMQATVARILARDLIRDRSQQIRGAASAGVGRALTTAEARVEEEFAPREDDRLGTRRIGRLRLGVQRLERQAELRLETLETLDLSLEANAMRLRVANTLREGWEARRETAAAHEQGGTFSQDPSPFASEYFASFEIHTSNLLSKSTMARSAILAELRAAPGRAASTAQWLLLVGAALLSSFVVRRLAPRIERYETESVGRRAALRALRWSLFPLPLSLVLLIALAMGLFPLVLEPLAWWFVVVPPVLAGLRPAIRTLLPAEGTETVPASAARFLRVSVRATVQLACLLQLALVVMPVLGYPPPALELVRGAFLLVVVTGVTLALMRKRELLSAAKVSEQSQHAVINVLRASLRRLYPLLFVGPMVSLAVYLAGYRNLAALMVRRGLVVLAVLTLGPFLHSQLMAITRRLVGFPDGGGPFLLPEASSKAAYRAAGPVITLLVGIVGMAVLAAGWGYDGDLLSSLTASLTYPLIHVGEREISLLSVVVFATVLVVTFFAIRAVLGTLRERVYPLYDLTQGMRASIDTLVKYVLFLGGVVIGLQVVGIGLGFLAVFAGVIGIGIGFGSQALAANFIAGLILQFTRPIEVGDHIEVEGILGQVLRITSYSTVVRTYDNLSVIVPNSTLLGNSVVNWTEGDKKVRVAVTVGVAYGSDVDKVKQLLLEAAAGPRLVRKLPRPTVLFSNFGDSSLDFKLRVWIDNPQDLIQIQSDLRDRIDARFRAHGIEIPFPQRDLHLRSSAATLDIVRKKGWEVATDTEGAEAQPAAE